MHIIYVLSLGHSGSTFLSLLLSDHESLIALGEMSQTLRDISSNNCKKSSNNICSCGKIGNNCNLWSHIINYNINKDKTFNQLFQQTLNMIEQKYPNETIVDISKELIFLKNYQKNKKVKVILLIRDFRSWSISSLKNDIRKKRIKNGYVSKSYKWLYNNLKYMIYLKIKKIEYLIISYEKLVFQTEKELPRIFNFINVKNGDITHNPSESKHHILFGNRMRQDKHKTNNIIYDGAWITSYKIILYSLILFPVYIFNSFIYYKVNKEELSKESLITK